MVAEIVRAVITNNLQKELKLKLMLPMQSNKQFYRERAAQVTLNDHITTI